MTTNTFLGLRTAYICVFLGLRLSAQVHPQSLNIEGYRPLALAAEKLEEQYGIPITYEDPEYSYRGDIVETTDPRWRAAHPSDPRRALAPRPGRLVVLDTGTDDVQKLRADIETALSFALTAYGAGGQPGHFRLDKRSPFLHIVPTQIRDANGAWREQGSPLDRLITFPTEDRTGLETLESIISALNVVPGKKVCIGMVPNNYLLLNHITIGSRNELARAVLTRALLGLHWRDPLSIPAQTTSWQLFYAPDGEIYFLNIHGVQRTRP